MKNILVVPDIHLKFDLMRDNIESIVKSKDIEEVIYIGDYFDDWGQLLNESLYFKTMEEIDKFNSKLKLDYDIKVTMLIGNHELSYLFNLKTSYSCPNNYVKGAISKWIKINDMQVAYQVNNILFSHAGFVSKPEDWVFNRVEEHLKDLYPYTQSLLSPLWIRPEELLYYVNFEYDFQVIGHTPTQTITEYDKNIINVDTWSQTSDFQDIGDKSFLVITKENEFIRIKIEQ